MNLLRHHPFLLAVALVVAAPALVEGPVTAQPAPPGSALAPAPDVRLTAVPGSVVRSASYGLGSDRLGHVAGTRQHRTAPLATTTYEMVALTWRGEDSVPAKVRTRTDDSWSTWRRLPLLTDLPDSDSGEGNGVRGTDLLWVGPSDGVQVSIRGTRPRALRLALIDPGVLPSDTGAALKPAAGRAATGSGAPRPTLLYRSLWGADESWRNGGPYFGRTIQQVHLHHTATGNDYTMADVPALIRGMYRYHTHNLGWSDIGYNFLVDRFGRSWVGRAGGANKIVRGAHTLGFNETSVGIAVIGNYEEAWPSDRVLTAIVRLAAWKLDRFHRKPTGWVRVYSHGSDKYPAGETVTLPVIDGHRDTNDTACPGAHLYAQLAKIRERTQRRVDRW
jgi:hypothetical protein